MRRTVPVAALTAGALALLSRFHTSPISLAGSVAATAPTSEPFHDTGRSAAPTTAPSSPTPSTVAPPSGRRSSSTSSTTKPSTAIQKVSPTTRTASGAIRTIDGPVISNRYGNVQVEITVKGHQLVDVQALELPADRSRSARISQQAGPILRTEALQAQGANIQAVSGASYTSDSYQRSLQAALDRANS